MSNQIVPFEFGGEQVRSIGSSEFPEFIASDVLAILELNRSSLTALDDDEKGVHTVDTLGGAQSVTTISESGLYSLVLRSRKPEARAFKRWITREVIPAIRKTGSYLAPAGPELLALAVLEAQSMIAAKDEQIAVLEPKAGAWDEIASGDGDYSVADAAKMLARAGVETGRDRLFASLQQFGWVFRQSGRFQAKQTAVDAGYLRQKPQSHLHPETREVVLDAPQVRVTLRGVERLRVRLGSVLHAVEAVAS